MNKDEEFNIITENQIKNVIRNHYLDIAEEDVDDIYQTIIENFDVATEDDVLNILLQAEEQNGEEQAVEEQNVEEQAVEEENEVEETVEETAQIEEPIQSDNQKAKIDEDLKEMPTREEAHKNVKTKDKTVKTNSNKKKKIIIFSIIAAVIIVGIIVTLVIIFKSKENKEPEVKAATTWQNVLKAEAKDGSLKQKIQNEIDDLKINATEANVMLLDIDSDEKFELIAYAEDKSTKEILTFEIDEEISFEKDYKMSSEDSLGYVYNKVTSKAYWYTAADKYTIISSSDKEVENEDFESSYYIITKKYKDKNILDQTKSIDLSSSKKDVSEAISKIINNKYTNDELLEDNDITLKDVKEKIAEEKEAEEKAKEEQKRLEEEAAKKAAEEEAAKKAAKKAAEEAAEEAAQKAANTNTKINGYNLTFGKYVSEDGKSSLEFNSEGTIKYNGSYTCKYEETKGTSEYYISCGDMIFNIPANNTLEINDGTEEEIITFKYSTN